MSVSPLVAKLFSEVARVSDVRRATQSIGSQFSTHRVWICRSSCLSHFRVPELDQLLDSLPVIPLARLRARLHGEGGAGDC